MVWSKRLPDNIRSLAEMGQETVFYLAYHSVRKNLMDNDEVLSLRQQRHHRRTILSACSDCKEYHLGEMERENYFGYKVFLCNEAHQYAEPICRYPDILDAHLQMQACDLEEIWRMSGKRA